MQRIETIVEGSFDTELLYLLGEQLKNPLVQIAQLSELGDKDQMIHAQAQRALNTIDTVLLYRRFATGQTKLRFEPVHVGSAISQVATLIEPQMQMFGCRAEFDIQQSLGLVDVDRQLLKRALLSLWQAFISTAKDTTIIRCGAHKTARGIRVTISGNGEGFDVVSLAKVNTKSTQPLTSFAGPAADLLAARGMFSLAGSTMRATRVKGAQGFGATLRISQQMQFV